MGFSCLTRLRPALESFWAVVEGQKLYSCLSATSTKSPPPPEPSMKRHFAALHQDLAAMEPEVKRGKLAAPAFLLAKWVQGGKATHLSTGSVGCRKAAHRSKSWLRRACRRESSCIRTLSCPWHKHCTYTGRRSPESHTVIIFLGLPKLSREQLWPKPFSCISSAAWTELCTDYIKHTN